MSCFYELNGIQQTAVVSLFIFWLMYQFGYLLLLHQRVKKVQFLWNELLTILVFLMIPFLGSAVYGQARDRNTPTVLLLAVWLVLWSYTTYFKLQEAKHAKNTLSSNALKESFDTLPTGICFFSENGLPVLCNTQMQKIVTALSGRDLQTLAEVREALAHPAPGVEILTVKDKTGFRLLDRSVWAFQENEVQGEDGTRYLQLKATEFTKLYELQEELTVRNGELQAMVAQVQRVSENIAEITRQQETLTAKMRVHNKMGNCLLAARRFLAEGCPAEKKTSFLELWCSSLDSLQEEVTAKDDPDACDEVIRIAREIGVEVKLTGQLPEDARMAYLLVVALRECVTNALLHAKASELYMTVGEYGGRLLATYANNGIPPKETIEPGGGLSSLRERIEKAGGNMTIQSIPCFVLTVNLPKLYEGSDML